ncbi:MAG: tRNA pseudouridine(38-40) synthase TruA [Pirellulales bacterium]
MKRWFHLTLAYDGTRYGGWQIQPNSVTVQQKLEEALAAVAGYRVKTLGSGRTDAGVHAESQVAGFSLEHWRPGPECLIPPLNRRLPEDIVVRDCRDVRPGFHAIRDAVSKRYRYTIRVSRIPNPFTSRYEWLFHRTLDVDIMREASQWLVGTRDFRNFQALGAPRKSTVRTVSHLEIDSVNVADGQIITIEIESNGFLYNMVRKIVGALVQVGRHRAPPSWIQEVLESPKREATGHTAPAQGLCLIDVKYHDACFQFDPSEPISPLESVDDSNEEMDE